MPSPNPLRRLFERYQPLAEIAPRSLSDDELRSLRFYRAEQLKRDHPDEFDTRADRVHTWIRNLTALELFVARNYQLPRANRRREPAFSDPEERHLEQWLNYQTRPTTAGLHCSYQADRIALIPGFSATRFDDRWRNQYEGYRRFLTEQQQAPMLRSSDPRERALAGWAAKQRMHHRNGSLPAHRHAALDALPQWAWGTGRN